MPNKQRVEVAPLPGPVQVTPKATPVDTFHTPGLTPPPVGDTELAQTMRSLGKLQPALNDFADVLERRKLAQMSDQMDAGVANAQARQLTLKGLKEAIDRGDIPAAASPAFIHGMREQVYRIEGMKYDDALRQSYAQSDARNSDDITSFLHGFNQGHDGKPGYLENLGVDWNDPSAGKVLAPMMAASQANLMQIHRSERNQQIEQTAVDNTYREVQGILKTHNDYPMISPDPAGLIQDRVNGMITHGLNGTLANKAAIDATNDFARDNLSTRLLDHLDNVNTGNGTLGSTQYAKDQRRATEKYVWSTLEENDRINSKVSDDQTKAAVKQNLTDGSLALMADPSADVSSFQKNLYQLDPKAGNEFYAWQQARIKGAENFAENEGEVISLSNRVYAGQVDDPTEILAMNTKKQINLATAKQLIKDLHSDYRDILKDPTIAHMNTTLGNVVRGGDQFGFQGKAADNLKAGRAMVEFQKAMINWRAANPNATDLERTDYADKVSEKLIKVYNPDAYNQAGPSVKVDTSITPDIAKIAPPNAIDYSKQLVVQDPAAFAECKASRGKSGVIFDLAQKAGVDPQQLYLQQLQLYNQSKSQSPSK